MRWAGFGLWAGPRAELGVGVWLWGGGRGFVEGVWLLWAWL